MKRRLTSNDVIDLLLSRGGAITKTHTRKGAVYAFEDTLQVVPGDVAERMIEKGIVLGAGDAQGVPGAETQTYRLAASWGGRL